MIELTNDGSQTIYSEQFNEHYHSTHGALNEALHVFIKHGLNACVDKQQIDIFEMGFGTGLNAYLSFLHKAEQQNIHYDSIELYPLEEKIISQLNYAENKGFFINSFHKSPWDEVYKVSDTFSLKKIHDDILKYEFNKAYDIIYFDAFSPRHQEDCWSDSVFQKMYKILKPGGILVSYCAKGEVKRRLKRIGFEVETLEGPPGKREMIRAHK